MGILGKQSARIMKTLADSAPVVFKYLSPVSYNVSIAAYLFSKNL